MDCYQSKQCDFSVLSRKFFFRKHSNKEITTATISNKVLNKPTRMKLLNKFVHIVIVIFKKYRQKGVRNHLSRKLKPSKLLL
jgi:hypothetical protein